MYRSFCVPALHLCTIRTVGQLAALQCTGDCSICCSLRLGLLNHCLVGSTEQRLTAHADLLAAPSSRWQHPRRRGRLLAFCIATSAPCLVQTAFLEREQSCWYRDNSQMFVLQA